METMPPADEKLLLQKISEGDEPSFRRLYDQYRNKIYSTALRITGMETAAEDVVQEVFIKVWTNREQLPGIVNFNAWIHAITRHHIYNSLRKLANEEQFLRHLIIQKPKGSDTMEAVAYNELHKLLDTAVSRLTPQQKKVYLLSRAEGMSHEQIAAKLGLSRETVKSYMKDALHSIRDFLRRNERLLTLVAAVLIEQLW